jgi:hypothetical protein
MKTAKTFLGFLILATGLCLVVAAGISLFLIPDVHTFFNFLIGGFIALFSGIFILRKCSTLPMSDQRVHISHRLAR